MADARCVRAAVAVRVYARAAVLQARGKCGA